MNLEKASKYLKLAKFQAELFSKDPSTKVCAIFLAPKTHQILSTGFNGFPRNIDETITNRWEKPVKYTYVIHAEINCICNASRRGTPLEGSIAVVTLHPCVDCCKALIQSGISMVITETPNLNSPTWGESFKTSIELFKEAKIELIYINQ
jgi:dCMP deaminase